MANIIIEYDNGDRTITDISDEQALDIDYLASTTSDTYKPIHELMEGIKRCFDEID